MAEETDPEHGGAPAGAGLNPAAISLALDVAAHNEYVAAKAEAFLEKQSALNDEQNELTQEQKTLVRLQVELLALEPNLRHWWQRVRHLSETLKLTFEPGLALIVLPDWGHLYLKWDEALFCTGQKVQAEKRFSATAYLELSHKDTGALHRRLGAPT